MKRMNFLKLTVAALTLFSATLYSCKKDDKTNQSAQTARVNMHLTDAPADYDAVYIDIQSVEVTMEGSAAITIPTIRPGVYDLLKFKNGMDTLLARADIPAGKISQMRLVLGVNNSVVVDGKTYAMNTPSAQESGLKLNLKQEFAAGGSYDVWLDFDAAKSIVETGSGKFQLKPVIRAYSALTDGRVKGYVLPGTALATVYLTDGVNTYAAIPAADGFFMFAGIPEGTYSVTLDASLVTFTDVTINNVQVKYGATVDLGVTTLVP
ncbi:MAG: DUF4382 domain-containing protein [Chitinophagales bacterium]|nr:DUF4382 domain-containing protein [Chitinophagales bacterium]